MKKFAPSYTGLGRLENAGLRHKEVTYGPARRKTVLAIYIGTLSHSPKAPMVRRIKPTVKSRADQGSMPVTLHDLYLL
jgi:hypothetical protein